MTTTPHFTPTQRQLLQQIAAHDHGDGIVFKLMPRARYQHPHTNHVFNGRNTDPVRITDAGRQYVGGS